MLEEALQKRNLRKQRAAVKNRDLNNEKEELERKIREEDEELDFEINMIKNQELLKIEQKMEKERQKRL